MGVMMELSLDDYKTLQSKKEFFFPKNFLPFNVIDKCKYQALEAEHKDRGLKISDTFEELRLRTGKEYFHKVYPAQSLALNFSESSFPTYRFLMPDVLTDDWLAIVDFHKKFSRDHALHQPLTSYIIFRLLGGGISNKSLQINGKYLLDLCVEQVLNSPNAKYIRDYLLNLDAQSDLLDKTSLSKEIWKSLFYETAMVAAIFHDIGYPWQYINRLSNSLKASDFNLKHLPSNAKYIRDTFKNRLIMYPFFGYKLPSYNTPCDWEEKLLNLLSDSLYKTHGFPGALGFLYLNDLVRRYPYASNLSTQQLCVEWAALGIMMHDMKGIYWGKGKTTQPENDSLRLAFDKDPLSCIIAFADVLQDFERPMVKFDININDKGSLFNYDFSCQSTVLSVVNDTIEVRYNFKNEEYRIVNIDFKKEEEKEYFDPQYGYLDLSAIGIKKVKLICDYQPSIV
ncbi:hypothetical protein FACS189441_2270 [Betaproteobacteria bacterium]|nr:hypothetical protein FACS189441_2270 [Betaproteobacteria bacterium]